MAKIFFSMAGEGRGHATRVRALVEHLRDEHEIALFAPKDAYNMLAPAYRGTPVRSHRIPGLVFQYGPDKRLDFKRTALGGARYLLRFNHLIGRLERHLRRERPDLVITDFEPALPRAARRLGIPFLSINHQHTFVCDDFSALPPRLRRHANMMGRGVRLYYQGQEETVISQFYFPPTKPKYRDSTTHVGVLLRPELIRLEARPGEHVLAYLRKFSSPGVLAALRQCGRPVRLYGLGEHPPEDNITYHAIDPQSFVEDLATCAALVCTAGNQLIGESLYYGKPVFAMPEANQHEQTINAWFLEKMGCGDWEELETVDPHRILSFLDRMEDYRSRIVRDRMNGTPDALAVIERHLERLGKL